MALAGVVHETEKQVENLLAAVHREPVQIERIREMVRQLSVLKKGITYILRKSPISEKSMSRVVEHVLFDVKHRFRHHDIAVINGFDRLPDLKARFSRNLISIAILNIIDNAIWWLGNKAHKDKKIYIGPSLELSLGPALVISDNGSGFIDSPEDVIRPFFQENRKVWASGFFSSTRL